jgi:hypothetical protein
MASGSNTFPMTVFVDDLAATIEDTDRAASSITRELSRRAERQKRFTAASDENIRQIYALLAATTDLMAQSKRLRENISAARQTMMDLRRELAKFAVR